MQGEKLAQEEFIYYGTLDALVPEDDFLRRVEAVLDLTWLRQATRHLYKDDGRPSIDPVVIAKLLVIAYLHGIASERDLMRQVQVNLSFRRYIHYNLSETLPDHSSLSRGRQRLGEATVLAIFQYMVRCCVDAGLVGRDLQSIDSTFIEANASLDSLQPRLVVAAAEDFTKRLFVVNPVESEEQGPTDKGSTPPPPAAYETARPSLSVVDEKYEGTPPAKGKAGLFNESYVSKTDPDAGFGRSGSGKFLLGYRTHYAVDKAHNIITAVRTTGAQHGDAGQLVPLIDQIREQGIFFESVAADGGYSTADNYHALRERGINAFIPLQRRGPEVKGLFGRGHFTYDAVNDRYRCPNGAWLERKKSKPSQLIYMARAKDCQVCPLRERCTTAKARILKLNRYEADLDAARVLLETLGAKRAAIDRRIYSERTFAEGKESHGLGRAKCPGLANVSIQALLTATVLNLKRYLRAQTRAFPAAQAARAAFSSLRNALRPCPGSC